MQLSRSAIVVSAIPALFAMEGRRWNSHIPKNNTHRNARMYVVAQKVAKEQKKQFLEDEGDKYRKERDAEDRRSSLRYRCKNNNAIIQQRTSAYYTTKAYREKVAESAQSSQQESQSVKQVDQAVTPHKRTPPPLPPKNKKPELVKALWDCEPAEDTELAFKEGDIIVVKKKDPESGWSTGYLLDDVTQTKKDFPANYTTPVKKQQAESAKENDYSVIRKYNDVKSKIVQIDMNKRRQINPAIFSEKVEDHMTDVYMSMVNGDDKQKMLELMQSPYFDINYLCDKSKVFINFLLGSAIPERMLTREEGRKFNLLSIAQARSRVKVADVFIRTYCPSIERKALGVVLGRNSWSQSFQKCDFSPKVDGSPRTVKKENVNSARLALNMQHVLNLISGYAFKLLDVNHKDYFGQTVLHNVCYVPESEKIDESKPWYPTPRNLEIRDAHKCRLQTAKTLLETDHRNFAEKLDVNLVGGQHNTDIDVDYIKGRYRYDRFSPDTALNKACIHNNLKVLEVLLQTSPTFWKEKLDVNVKEKKTGYTALHRLVIHRNYDAVWLLLNLHSKDQFLAPLDFFIPCNNGKTVLDYANAIPEDGTIPDGQLPYGTKKTDLKSITKWRRKDLIKLLVLHQSEQEY